MYVQGDIIVYGTIGVCRIEGMVERNLPGTKEKAQYYLVSPIYQKCNIYTPVEGGKVFMRPVITKDEAENLIDMIPSMQTEVLQGKRATELIDHYRTVLSAHDCQDLIQMTMSIYAKKQVAEQQNRRFGTVDEKYMKKAEELLFGELASALGIDISEVQDYISKRLKTDSYTDFVEHNN